MLKNTSSTKAKLLHFIENNIVSKQILFIISFCAVIMMALIMPQKIQAQSSGVYYIINNNNNAYVLNSATNWYLVPASNGGDATVSISYYTWNNDANTPLVTTYQTGKDLNSAWAVVKDGDYYYLIHILTGTYMAVNDGVGTNSNRRRLHMESTNTPGDIHRFKITSHSGSPLPYSINPKNVTSGHMYLNPSNGNKPAYYAIQTSDGGYQVGGTLGLYNKNATSDAGSKWFLESTILSAPSISDVNPFTNRFAITETNGLPAGYTILYRTDGNDPDIANYGGDYPTKIYTDSVLLAANSTVKAVVVRYGIALTSVASKSLAVTIADAPTVTVNCDNTINLSCGNIPAASIRYTIDGEAPTNTTGTLYTGENIVLAAGNVLRAVAYTPVSTSAVTTRTHTLDHTEAPSITYNASEITITGAGTLYYTTNGTDPVIGAPGVTSGTSPIVLAYDGSSEIDIRAIAKSSALNPSCMARVVTISEPTITVAPDNCSSASPRGNVLTISGHNDGRTFWYALVAGNDSPAPDPDAEPNPYTQYTLGSPINLDDIASSSNAYYTIHAYAMDALGVERSSIAKAIHRMKTGGKPTIVPPMGSSSIMYIENGVYGDVAIFTTDEETPDDPSDDISNEFPVASDGTVEYSVTTTATGNLSVSFKHGEWETSCEAIYLLPDAPEAPIWSQSCDNKISLHCSDGMADIHYTIDGSEPTIESPTYTAGCLDDIETDTRIRAKAFHWFRSSSELDYTFSKSNVEAPTFFINGTEVTLHSATPDASIYYTFSTNGDQTIPADPAAVTIDPANLYTSSYTLTGITKINAIAVKDGIGNSCPVSATTREGYTINTVEQLNTIASDASKSDKYWFIGADIDAQGFTATVPSFTGVIEGNYHTISNLTVPLIATATDAVIHDIMFKDVNINVTASSTNAGAIAQTANGSTKIYNCGILGDMSSVSGTDKVGSLVGLLDGSARVINCFSYATIGGGNHRGGIVGYNNFPSTTKAGELRTMVMNCMFYGEISTAGSPSSISPVYGGEKISNKHVAADNTGLNNYNYFYFDRDYVGSITEYNCALGAEERFLNRFEFYRQILNSTRDVAAWYVCGDATNKEEMAKWVLDKKTAPYPILKKNGIYHSVVNFDAANAAAIDPDNTNRNQGRKLGTLTVKIRKGSGGAQFNNNSGSSITTSQLTLNIIDKDPDNFNFNYKKIQLPYYCQVGTGNYTNDRVVAGWKIVEINGSTTGTGTFQTTTNDAPSFNFADRTCTKKDLYSESGRVFNQGAYWEVPDNVTEITIEPYWAKCVFLSDEGYDVTYYTTTKYTVTPLGTRPTIFNGSTVYTDVATAMTNLAPNSSHTVYDYAVVLVGNYHQYNTNAIINGNTPVTFMSADVDGDMEPDNTLCYYHDQRKAISPIRFDFLNMPGVGSMKRTWDSRVNPQPGIMQPKGWFEITNTVLIRFGQFEYTKSDIKTIVSPCILQGGVYEQFVSSHNYAAANTNYLHIGGNAWFNLFNNGCHTINEKPTALIPITVTGGDFGRFYLTGIYRPNTNNGEQNAECYIDGGRFNEVAGAGMQQVKGNVTWLINGADISSFFGGGINDAKPITGNISTTISNSWVTEFHGGPKFGTMSEGKTVTTVATDCHFGLFFGAGYGGTSFNRVDYEDASEDRDTWNWGSWVSSHYDRAYNAGNGGIGTNYEYELILHSDGQKTVGRFYVNYAALSLASTRNVTSTLTGCTIGTFYGGGRLGSVKGDVSSTLTDCNVEANAFGSGFSAAVPDVMVMDKENFVVEPKYNREAGVFNDAQVEYPSSTQYYWSNEYGNNSSPFTKVGDDYYIFTPVSLNGLGSVEGNATLTLQGRTVVAGDVYGGGAKSSSNTVEGTTRVNIYGGTVEGNVFGGGMGDADNAVTEGRVEVYVGNEDQEANNVVINGNVFGGNNANGSPKDDIYVHIWKTKHNAHNDVGSYVDMADFQANASHDATAFAIQAVYGGGNEANYEPLEGKSANVYIHNCDNTIMDIYGGGRAADVGTSSVNTNTHITVDGGRFENLFAGGDGHTLDALGNPRPANIFGNVYAWVRGGYYSAVFGASNTAGTISGSKNLTVDKSGPCEHEQEELVESLFGGGNMANVLGPLSLTVGCGVGHIHEVYGGCNLADVNGDITLTINGGTFDYVYGGSKGRLADDSDPLNPIEEKAANINGNVTLNIYGGDIGNAFGGSNINGNITGTIAVNVDWSQSDCPGKQLDNVYGGSNLAQYSPTAPEALSPNYSPLVTLTNGRVGINDFDPDFPNDHGCVFGGGKGETSNIDAGKVTSNPKVLMNPSVASNFGIYNPSTSQGFIVLNAIYGGGEVASVDGSTTVEITNGHVGCDDKDIDHDNGYVFGAGKGHVNNYKLATVTKNSSVTMSGGYVHNTLFGGGQMASVGTFTYADADYVDANPTFVLGEQNSCANNTGTTLVTISGGQIGPSNVTMRADLGYVFGAGMGYYTQPDAPGYTDPSLTSEAAGLLNARFGYVDSAEVRISDNAVVVGAVYGGSENGQVLHNCGVKVSGGQIGWGKNQASVYSESQWTRAKNAVSSGTESDIISIANEMTECDSWPYTIANNYMPYDPYADEDGAEDASTANPGDGHTFFGNVFGGGSGIYAYRVQEGGVGAPKSVWYQFQGRVRGNTRVEVTGGHILTSLYGGCEYSDVLGDCTVKFTGGTLGIPRSVEATHAHPVTCYLFGAGKGDQRTIFNQLTNVDNTNVTVGGDAVIFGSVFGGGEDGHVKYNAVVNITGNAIVGTQGISYYDGNIFGGGRGFGGTAITAGSIGGNAEVNIDGNCNIFGSVFGGGRLASVGIHFVSTDDPRYGKLQGNYTDNTGHPEIPVDNSTDEFLAQHGNITININGGTIGNRFEFNAPVFSASNDYLEGDVVIYRNTLWRFIINHNAGAWNDDHVTDVIHTYGGNVYGSSMGRLLKIGAVDEDVASNFNPLWPGLAKCRNTEVNIGGTANIYSNVYGGGELGYVMNDTKVSVGGNAVVGHIVGTGIDHTYFGSVFGGGYGSDNITAHVNDSASVSGSVTAAMHAGRVYGNSEVEIKESAQIWGNVYGGGELASVGRRWIHMCKDNNALSYLPNVTENTIEYASGVYSYPWSEKVGNSKVTISGGTIGNVTDITIGTHRYAGHVSGKIGSVFGGGKGRPGLYVYDEENDTYYDYGFHFTRMAYVDKTDVKITGSARIAGSVFGGAENGHVRYDTKVTMDGGIVGLQPTAEEIATDNYGYSPVVIYHGNIYGGGRGIDITEEGHLGAISGQVFRSSQVEISGGTVYHNVYGGGSIATVGTPNSMNDPTLVDGSGTATVTINGNAIIGYPDAKGLNSGRVFGSGRGMAGNEYASRAYTNNTYVTIGDDSPAGKTCHVYGDVFGSGENGHVEKHTHLYIKQGCLIGENRESLSNDDHKEFVGNVYGGGRGVDLAGGQISRTAGLVRGSTHITVTGGQIFHNIYGGGSLASVGDTVELSNERRTAGEIYAKFNDTVVYDYDAVKHTALTADAFDAANANGHSYIFITGGKIGTNGQNNGRVFGGGRGNAGLSNDTITITAAQAAGLTQGIDYRIDNGVYILLSKKNPANDSIIWRDYTNHTYVTGTHIVVNYPSVSTTTSYPDDRSTLYNPISNYNTAVNNTATSTAAEQYIRGSVFGGGDNGHVRGNTQVVIENGRIGTLTGNVNGDVFGGGSGVGRSYDGNFSEDAGKVYGNTYVNINGGWILHNVYGGGNMAGVGDFTVTLNGAPAGREHDKDAWLTGLGTVAGYTVSGGTCNVTVSGGRIGEQLSDIMASESSVKEGMDSRDANLGGNVFGSSRGQSSDDILVNRMAYTNNTNVTIENEAQVAGSVFGGGENGHVFYTANVNISGGTIGVNNQATSGSIYRGNAYGGGRGIDPVSTTHHFNRNSGLILGNSYLTMTGGTVYHNVFGGGSLASLGTYTYIEEAGDTKDSVIALQRPETGKTEVTITGGTVGINGVNNGNVFGAGRGLPGVSNGQKVDLYTFVDRTYVTVGGTADIRGNVFGSGDNGHVLHNTQVVVYGGTIGTGNGGPTFGNVFGSGRGADTYLNNSSEPTLSPVAGRVYGNTDVYVVGGILKNNVYGGGYLATVDGNTNVTVATSATVNREGWNFTGAVPTPDPQSVTFPPTPGNPSVYGDVFGGSALGAIGSTSGTTTVNILGGTIGSNSSYYYNAGTGAHKGNIFGGGNGDAESQLASVITTGKRDANVRNTVHVNIGNADQYDTPTAGAIINGAVFGGNNIAGSPTNDIFVDVYSTQHTVGTNDFNKVKTMVAALDELDTNDLVAVDALDDAALANLFALNAVYGGGNKATVIPATSGKTTQVTIHDCDENTIQYVYGGGNAADLGSTTPSALNMNTDVIIEGGHIYQVFAGGNGAGNHTNPTANDYNPGANVYGDASVTIKGGAISQVFGGSNSLGMVHGASMVAFDNSGSCQLVTREIYGGGNVAPAGNVVITIPCGTTGLTDVYGGANNADIGTRDDPKTVTLNILGGDMTRVFGGNKNGGTIYGNVTVNVHGSNPGHTISEVFGGCNLGGGIVGNIIVNIDSNSASCPLSVDYVYGGGNLVEYAPDSVDNNSDGIFDDAYNNPARISPQVNIINGSVNKDVFGGGLGTSAVVTANTQVNIYSKVKGNVFGGGNAASVTGNTNVNVQGHSVVKGNVFGGGNEAAISADTEVIIKDNPHLYGNVYGGGNQGPVGGNTRVIVK